MPFKKRLTCVLLTLPLLLGSNALASPAAGDPAADRAAWQSTHDARERYFETTIGPVPADMQTMPDMAGLWPGGGLHAIPAARLGKGLTVYTTCGLSNADMPASAQHAHVQFNGVAAGPGAAKAAVQQKVPAPHRLGAAGYGYEMMVLADEGQKWPLGLLQWAVHAEITKDTGLLGRVETDKGITIERLDIGWSAPVNVLITKAEKPLPEGITLPAGKMELLVATLITDDEMRWSVKHGRMALALKLQEAGIGQRSDPARASVIR